MIACEVTDEVAGIRTLPRHSRRPDRELAARRLVMKRRQRIASFDLSRCDNLRNGKRADLSRLLVGVDIGHRRIGRPQIKPDNKSAEGGRVGAHHCASKFLARYSAFAGAGYDEPPIQ